MHKHNKYTKALIDHKKVFKAQLLHTNQRLQPKKLFTTYGKVFVNEAWLQLHGSKKLFVSIIYQMKWLFTLKENGDEYWMIQYIFITSPHLKVLRVWIVIELLFISFGQWMHEYQYTRCCIHIQFILHNFRRFNHNHFYIFRYT